MTGKLFGVGVGKISCGFALGLASDIPTSRLCVMRLIRNPIPHLNQEEQTQYRHIQILAFDVSASNQAVVEQPCITTVTIQYYHGIEFDVMVDTCRHN